MIETLEHFLTNLVIVPDLISGCIYCFNVLWDIRTFCLAVAKVPQSVLTWLQDLNVCEHCVLADPCLL